MHLLLKLLPQKGQARTLLSLLCLLITVNAFATDYYVALTGVDTGNEVGSQANPFRTINKAATKAGSGDVVIVLPGVYRETVEIQKNGAIFKPRDGKGTVTINGTDLMLGWQLVAGSTYKTTMNWDLGLDNATKKWGSNQLFQDGKMIELARWPRQTSNDLMLPTTAKADTVLFVGTPNGEGFYNEISIVDAQLSEEPNAAARWTGAKIWINLSRLGSGLDGQGWTGTVKSVSGNTINVENISGRLPNRAWGVGPNTEYFVFDPLPAAVEASGGVDALLKPGQWWKNGTDLYVKTNNGTAPANSETATSNRIESKRRHFAFWPKNNGNLSGYTIEDFDLFACSISTDRSFGSGINEAANNITIKGLTVKYVSHQTSMAGNWQNEHYGFTGIVISGRNNTLSDCDIMYSATSAVSLQGAGHKLLRNKIHETNYMCSNSGAVNTGFVCLDAEIAYNEIWNTTMMGVNMKAFKSSNPEVKHTARIHHNEIYDFMIRSHDSSALDVVGEDMQWVRIDHNRIYNTRPEARIGGRKYGIYLDYGGGDNSLNRVRATVDHNVVWDVNNPMTLNSAWDAHIFNNVLLTVTDQLDAEEPSKGLSINLKLGEAKKAGTNVLVFNNIVSEAITGGKLAFGYAPIEKVESVLNNITNARGAVLNELFVNATSPMVPGQRSTRNYQLKSTATAAIDKGIAVEQYTTNYPLDRPIVGVTDIGAFEHPTSSIGTDTQAPSVPVEANFAIADLTGNSFRVSWRRSTDNVGVAYYEVYSNGRLVRATNDTTMALTTLEGSTTYFIKVRAVDGSQNRSEFSAAREVKTLAPVVDVDIAKTTTAPVIDGTKEATWTSPMLPIAKLAGGTAPDNAADFSGEWTSLWNDSNLYIFMDVNDNVKRVDDPAANGLEWYFDDHIEILVDPTFARSGGPVQYFMVRGKLFYKKIWNNGAIGEAVPNAAASLVEKTDGSGYRVEVKIPFTSLGITPQALSFIGIDVQIGDDDDGGAEDTRLSWITTDNGASGNSSLLGVAKFTAPGLGDDTQKPSAPTQVVASAIAPTSFTLNWTASTDNFGVASYEVFVNGNLVGTPNTTTFAVEGLIEGSTNTVQIKAKDRYNNLSDFSSLLKVTTPTRASAVKYESESAVFTNGTVATAITGFSGTGYVRGINGNSGGGSITYTVNVPAAGTYSAFTRYTEGGVLSLYVNGTRIGNVNFQSTTTGYWNGTAESGVMTLNLLAGENTVMLRIDGQVGNKNGPLHDYLAIFLPGADSQAPTAPTNVTASNTTANGFTLNWTGSTDNSGTPSYQVYSNGTLVTTTTSTTYNMTSLSPGTYVMTVKAVDATGNQSDASQAIEVDIVGGSVSIGNNPGFESNFTSWSTYGGASVNTNVAHVRSGARSGYFSNGGGNYVVTGLTPNTTYKVRAWVKAVSGTDIWVVVTNYGLPQVGARMTSTSWTQSGDIVFTTGANNTSATLVAWTGNGSSAYFDDYTIALNSSGVPVRTVSVNPASATLINPGTTQQLSATITPVNATNQTVSWSSSNTAVATVSNTGLVTAVSIGTATITATSAEGNKTATSAITVTRDWTKVDNNQANRGITYDANWGNFSESRAYAGTLHGSRNEDQLPEATFSFTGGRVRFYGVTRYNLGILDVYLDGIKVATVDQYGQNGEEVYDKMLWDSGEIASGAHTVKIKATNTTNLTAPNRLDRHKLTNILIDAFEFSTYSGCTNCRTENAEVASQAKAEAFTLKLHPNPASSEVSIDLSGFAGESAVQVKMSDMSGKLFLGQQVQIGEGVKQVTLPVSHLPQGLFFVTVQGSKTSRTAKLVITK